jgi:hypothetical protein
MDLCWTGNLSISQTSVNLQDVYNVRNFIELGLPFGLRSGDVQQNTQIYPSRIYNDGDLVLALPIPVGVQFLETTFIAFEGVVRHQIRFGSAFSYSTTRFATHDIEPILTATAIEFYLRRANNLRIGATIAQTILV